MQHNMADEIPASSNPLSWSGIYLYDALEKYMIHATPTLLLKRHYKGKVPCQKG